MSLIRPQWVFFGDSITQRSFSVGGWASLVADSYVRRIDVINRGYSGYNSRWAVKVLDNIFPKETQPIQLATIFFGANDAARPDRTSAKQHVPLDEYTNNIRQIVQHLQSLSVPAIVLITPPPVSEPHRLQYIYQTWGVQLEQPERTNDFTANYAAACLDLAAELDLPGVDLWNNFQKVEGWQEALLDDGLHLTAAGNAKVHELVLQAVQGRWPQLTPENLPWDLPEWSAYADKEESQTVEQLLEAHAKDRDARVRALWL